MTKNNKFIPIENKKPYEIVQELKNEVPSYEEFLKTYEGNDNYADLEDSDISVNRSYGPGNSQSSYNDRSEEGRVQRQAGRMVVSAASSFAPPPVQIATGVITKIVGEVGGLFSDNDAWKYTSELGTSMMTGGMIGQAFGPVFNDVYSSAPSGLRSILEGGKSLYEAYELQGGNERLNMGFHEFHKSYGVESDGGCSVCRG